jgi:hypothetical protein
LEECSRCGETMKNLNEAIDELKIPLSSLGFDIELQELKLTNVFGGDIESPMILVNGKNIITKSSSEFCEYCSNILGTKTFCSTFEYDGNSYSYPPKALIIEGILKEVIYPRKSSGHGKGHGCHSNEHDHKHGGCCSNHK